MFTSAFASRSDDSTYLEYADATGGNSLLLPNRNLDYGYARLDLGGSYQVLPWLAIYAQGENLLEPAAHRAHRLSQPTHEFPHGPAHSVGFGKQPLRVFPLS